MGRLGHQGLHTPWVYDGENRYRQGRSFSLRHLWGANNKGRSHLGEYFSDEHLFAFVNKWLVFSWLASKKENQKQICINTKRLNAKKKIKEKITSHHQNHHHGSYEEKILLL